MLEITIIGGGIGGCNAALEFANAGYKVLLIEKKSSLLAGSSDDAPCRLGLGFHYIDIETAKMYLRSTINVLKDYPDYVIGKDFPLNHHSRRGRYFVVKNSHFELDQVYHLHKELRAEYARLIEENPANAVVGSIDTFTQVLPVAQYKDAVNTDLVVAAFETAEQTLNWSGFKAHLISLVESHSNIKIYKNTEVKKARRTLEGAFEVFAVTKIKNGMESHVFKSKYVINASWENIEEINATVGFKMNPDEVRTNRTKVLAHVKLPTALEKSHSMFFCFGPHCSFTNIGNGYAYISYEPVTNLEVSTALKVSDFSKRLLDDGATLEEKVKYATKIVEGVARYIPAMAGARILDTRFGNVRTLGEVNIYSPESSFHRRNSLGVREQQIGWIDMPCMKLFYFQEGTSLVKKILENHIKADRCIDNIVYAKNLTGSHAVSFSNYLRTHYSSEELIKNSIYLANSEVNIPLVTEA